VTFDCSHSRSLREKYDAGEISAEVYEREESLEKNRISNISTTHSNIGYIVTLCLNLSLLLPLADNPRVNNYVIVMINSYWVLVGVWWCMFFSLFSHVAVLTLVQSSFSNLGQDRSSLPARTTS
jgi:uncharacterized membrane protein